MRLRPLIKNLNSFRAVNYQSPIQRVIDTTTKEHKLLQSEIKNYISNPIVINSHLNGTQYITESHSNCQISPLYNHPYVVK